MLEACIAEVIGTMLLILLGNGVVAGVVLNKTKSHNGGWIVITLAWGLAVFIGVLVAGSISGAHMNPAVTIALTLSGKFSWVWVAPYIVSQIIGAMLGQLLVWTMYYPHYSATDNTDLKLATHCTSPAIKHLPSNFASEVIGTFVLVLAILAMPGVVVHVGDPAIATAYPIDMGALGGIPVAFVVVVIGLSLGGTTGYAINPARDFGPRLFHAIMPIQGKGSSQWSYAWIPILGPILGSVIATGLYLFLKTKGVF
ncbi:MIP/aquaporin family protein [Francisella orientalis]|uniref:Aquaporin family protein n=4 Tax=Francisella orientalis TaxID=299583 RepID=A0AAP7FUP4_9GAMM|nr:MIP/aquaporin family protein [Francisella orientalis]AFJ43130.1 major intrinsic protein family permease [Francisella orientalis str. Toba 04]AHB98917.1 MIP family channel protein [Francisella orientalis LADL 07-285A]AKN86212.1 Major intrinsic protein family permease [Francisella orientalis FNO12]AKN87750.1 Major intrinsic protein family permease [Francisella orientalis FNO24]AKN89288.1 Major intrinsic protein family permease [Francisella orientalis]